ncbi:hypothetical protein BZG36_00293 [Bifiguratus adelaidae]|uniref:Velvet domain-containing protein n=1 Tax=Bifiguratus adelaidae TaxID=1938954 RepID=A0A261Y7P0_9FUNG|nr:hypothetical protein BZG36_00293 [Bifiguratus adelaidae]
MAATPALVYVVLYTSAYIYLYVSSYTIEYAQQPVRARACGFGEKDRRPIDCNLVVNPASIPSASQIRSTVPDTASTKSSVLSLTNPTTTRTLMGSTFSSASHLYNLEGDLGVYFVFQDMSVRTEGRFTLRCALLDVKGAQDPSRPVRKTAVRAEVLSKPFDVYSAKRFPGMTESTELSKCFARQGIKIPIRKEMLTRPTDRLYHTGSSGSSVGANQESESPDEPTEDHPKETVSESVPLHPTEASASHQPPSTETAETSNLPNRMAISTIASPYNIQLPSSLVASSLRSHGGSQDSSRSTQHPSDAGLEDPKSTAQTSPFGSLSSAGENARVEGEPTSKVENHKNRPAPDGTDGTTLVKM